MGRIWLEMLQKSCVKVNDVRYIGLYEEYCVLIAEGNKKSFAVAFLADKYGISERQAYYIIKRLSFDCNILAGG